MFKYPSVKLENNENRNENKIENKIEINMKPEVSTFKMENENNPIYYDKVRTEDWHQFYENLVKVHAKKLMLTPGELFNLIKLLFIDSEKIEPKDLYIEFKEPKCIFGHEATIDNIYVVIENDTFDLFKEYSNIKNKLDSLNVNYEKVLI